MKKNPRSLVPTKLIADNRDAKQLWRNSNEKVSREYRRISNEQRRKQRRDDAIDRTRADPIEEERMQDEDYENDEDYPMRKLEDMDESELLSDEDMPLATKLKLLRGMKRKNDDQETDSRTAKQKRVEAPKRRKRPSEGNHYESNRRKVYLFDDAEDEPSGSFETNAENGTVATANELATLDPQVLERYDGRSELPQPPQDSEIVDENNGWESSGRNRESDAPLIRVEDMVQNTTETDEEPLVSFQERLPPPAETIEQLPRVAVENQPPIGRRRQSSVRVFRPVVESVFKRPVAQPINSVEEPLTDLQSGFSVDLPTIAFASYTQRLNLRRVLLVLNATTPIDPQTQSRKWLGIKTFLNYFFGSSLKLFLGKRSVVRVFLISSQNDICAKLYRLDGGSRYVLTIVANFDYWNSLVELSDALPDVYFRSNSEDIARTYLRQINQVPLSASAARAVREPVANRVSSAMLQSYTSDSEMDGATENLPRESRVLKNVAARMDGQELEIKRGSINTMFINSNYSTAPPDSQNDQKTESKCTAAHDELQRDEENSSIDQAVSGLCLAHLVEMLIEKDLKSKVPNYVTLGQLFSGDKSTINPFKIQLHTR